MNPTVKKALAAILFYVLSCIAIGTAIAQIGNGPCVNAGIVILVIAAIGILCFICLIVNIIKLLNGRKSNWLSLIIHLLAFILLSGSLYYLG